MSQFRLPITAVPGCMVCGRDLGAEYTVKCTGSSVEWYCPDHAENPSDVMARLMESVNNLHQTLHVLYGDGEPIPGRGGLTQHDIARLQRGLAAAQQIGTNLTCGSPAGEATCTKPHGHDGEHRNDR